MTCSMAFLIKIVKMIPYKKSSEIKSSLGGSNFKKIELTILI